MAVSTRVRVGDGQIGLIAQERQPRLTNAIMTDIDLCDLDREVKAGSVAFAGFPLIIEQRLVGVMALFARRAAFRPGIQRPAASWRTASPWGLPDCSLRSPRKTPGKPRWPPAGRRASFWPT